MRRPFAAMFAVAIVLGSASAAAAARPAPAVHDITLSASTTDVTATCLGGSGGATCDGTVRVTLAGTVTGAPFTEVFGVKGPQSYVGTIDVPTTAHDETSGCYSSVSGSVAFFVSRGSGARLAFTLQLANATACGGGIVGTFTVDSSGSDVAAFKGSVGSGIFAVTSDLNVPAASASALSLDLDGQIALAK